MIPAFTDIKLISFNSFSKNGEDATETRKGPIKLCSNDNVQSQCTGDKPQLSKRDQNFVDTELQLFQHFVQNAEPPLQKRKAQSNASRGNTKRPCIMAKTRAKSQKSLEREQMLVKLAKEYIIKEGLSGLADNDHALFSLKMQIAENIYKQTPYKYARNLTAEMSRKRKTSDDLHETLWDIVEKDVKEIFAKNYKDPDFSISDKLKNEIQSNQLITLQFKNKFNTPFQNLDNERLVKLAVHHIFTNFEIGLTRNRVATHMLSDVNKYLEDTDRTPLRGNNAAAKIKWRMKRENLWPAIISEWKRIQNGNDTPKETFAKVEITPNFQEAPFSANAVIGSQNMLTAQPHENLPQYNKNDLKFLLNPNLQLDTDDSQSQNDPINPSDLLINFRVTQNSISNNNNYFQTL